MEFEEISFNYNDDFSAVEVQIMKEILEELEETPEKTNAAKCIETDRTKRSNGKKLIISIISMRSTILPSTPLTSYLFPVEMVDESTMTIPAMLAIPASGQNEDDDFNLSVINFTSNDLQILLQVIDNMDEVEKNDANTEYSKTSIDAMCKNLKGSGGSGQSGTAERVNTASPKLDTLDTSEFGENKENHNPNEKSSMPAVLLVKKKKKGIFV